MFQHRIFSTLPIRLIFCLVVLLCSATAFAQSDCCIGRVGDVNGDGGDEPTIGDVSYMIDLEFIDPYPLPADLCYREWDINQSGGANPVWDDISIGDISMLIDYLFITGPSLGLPYCPGHEGGPYGYIHAMTDCKLQTAGAAAGETCLNWAYDGQGVLSLTHVSAALNCCPQPSLTVSVVGNTILINEADSGLCHCECLYDIEYKVGNLDVGSYHIIVQEAVSSGGEPLDLWVDLAQSPSGSFCVDRPQYPWGSAPAGFLVDNSGCKSSGAAAASSLSPDQSCVDLQYDGAGTLTLTHGNAGFNCCPENISAQFSFDGSTITITEVEQLDDIFGGCS